jgi:hypothetical protein
MILGWLSKLLASLLVSLIFSAGLTVILDGTILNSHYLEGQLLKTNSYMRLSTALSKEIAQKSGSADPQVQAKLQTILTPALLQQKTTTALDQLQAYYKGKGSAPVIDLTDLAPAVQAAGVPLDSNSPLSKPITLGANTKVKDFAQTFKNIKLGTIAGAIVLAGLLLFVSWERHRYAALPDVLISVGVLFVLLALSFGFAPGVADHLIKFDSSSNAFASVASDLATSISHDLGMRFGLLAAMLLAIGIGVRTWLAKRRPAKPTPSTTQPVVRAAFR